MSVEASSSRPAGRARAAMLALLGFAALSVAGFASSFVPTALVAQQKPPLNPPDEKDGGEIVFQVVGSRMQKKSVLYSHEKHLATGLKCDDCHEKIFKKKLNANKFKMADVNRGEFCGTCHNEKPAADVKHPAFAPKGNCAKCHTLSVRDP
jgi:c(7)-type cytochrome triheme protein